MTDMIFKAMFYLIKMDMIFFIQGKLLYYIIPVYIAEIWNIFYS